MARLRILGSIPVSGRKCILLSPSSLSPYVLSLSMRLFTQPSKLVIVLVSVPLSTPQAYFPSHVFLAKITHAPFLQLTIPVSISCRISLCTFSGTPHLIALLLFPGLQIRSRVLGLQKRNALLSVLVLGPRSWVILPPWSYNFRVNSF